MPGLEHEFQRQQRAGSRRPGRGRGRARAAARGSPRRRCPASRASNVRFARLELGLGVERPRRAREPAAPSRGAAAIRKSCSTPLIARRPARRCSARSPTITRSAGRNMIVPEAVVRRRSLSATPSAASCSSSASRSARASPSSPSSRPSAGEVDAHPRQRTPPSGAQAGRRPAPCAESQAMIVLGIDPGLANTGYGVVARRGGRLLALDGGVIKTRAGARAGASPGRDPRRRRRAARRARAGRDGARGAVLRPERAHRLRRRAGARRGRCSRPASTACRAAATRRSRSRARSAATAAPRRIRSRAWSRRCSA